MYVTLIDRKLATVPGVPSLEDAQKVVGGYIETALRCPSKERKNISIDVYCNEEGLMIDLPIDYIRLTDGSPLAGNLVIVASDETTGEWVESTYSELKEVLNYILPVR